MNMNLTDAQKLLASRISDYLRFADRGELVCGNFLTPGEVACATAVAMELRAGERVFFFGGYDDAERKRLCVLPAFLSDMDGEPEEKARTYFPEEFSSAVRAIKIQGSGYRELSHRDYLGSIHALGIERFSLGDVVVLDENSAVIFCTDKIFDFLVGGIDRVASDKVSVSEFLPGADFSVKREFLPIRDTIASNRLDCVVGALTNLSREKAQALIRSGLCEVNYVLEQRVDVEVKELATITLRGHGKYQVVSFDGETKRGRLRLVAQKYV